MGGASTVSTLVSVTTQPAREHEVHG